AEPDGGYRPSGSSWGAVSPMCHKTPQKGSCLFSKRGFRTEGAREPELRHGPVTLAGPGEEEAEVEPDRLAAGEAPHERPEAGEGGAHLVDVLRGRARHDQRLRRPRALRPRLRRILAGRVDDADDDPGRRGRGGRHDQPDAIRRRHLPAKVAGNTPFPATV